MNRKSFLKSLGFGAAAAIFAPVAVAKLLEKEPESKFTPSAFPTPRKLQSCEWSVELEQDLEHYHGISTDEDIVQQLNREITRDYE